MVEMTDEQEHAYIVSVLQMMGWPRLEAIEEADRRMEERLKQRATLGGAAEAVDAPEDREVAQ